MTFQIRGVLNKITPEKFEKLIADILNIIGHGSNVVFKGVIVLIFEKALDEPKYSSMYAQLCKRLAEHAPNLEPPRPREKRNPAREGGFVFRNLGIFKVSNSKQSKGHNFCPREKQLSCRA